MSLLMSLSSLKYKLLNDVSSFCNTRVKSENDRLGSEEIMELERVCKRVISDEDEEGNTRKKLRLSKEQSSLLEDNFKRQKLALAKQLNLYGLNKSKFGSNNGEPGSYL
ncbi:hypothetical protein IFM89_034834 [Coptis chinensis]|uniref:Uncharacterized protein n=1 Tax=Coptis chinensis TaxID=261450 RepID=A0A835LPJ0_9MAGN|nr:hypothetical protein IFM89_034834 [Coptis chinensis]